MEGTVLTSCQHCVTLPLPGSDTACAQVTLLSFWYADIDQSQPQISLSQNGTPIDRNALSAATAHPGIQSLRVWRFRQRAGEFDCKGTVLSQASLHFTARVLHVLQHRQTMVIPVTLSARRAFEERAVDSTRRGQQVSLAGILAGSVRVACSLQLHQVQNFPGTSSQSWSMHVYQCALIDIKFAEPALPIKLIPMTRHTPMSQVHPQPLCTCC